ncbi:tyrosine-type recombinase/integrase [Pseudomonas taiwanensis]|uniref:tyrosine-type recombinase/integrase n=1 Tax=Pseudomonas taiwanensis TaxID=470150 RepID=UPI001645CE78|nr:tyrosine-type recombinase/integrase [Pseudomonas taiwanensis]MBC3492422.1 tyrosine-type recombinase/integrase [Pseudomonas taiwanensis]
MSQDEDEYFDKLIQGIEEEAKEAAEEYFEELHAVTQFTEFSEDPDGVNDDELLGEKGQAGGLVARGDLSFPTASQRQGNLREKLILFPSGDFPISNYSSYCDAPWILSKTEHEGTITIIFHNTTENLLGLKKAIAYYFLPAFHPLGSVRSFISSKKYAEAFTFLQKYVFDANHLNASEEHISAIGVQLLNQALDEARRYGSANAYNMLYLVITFWIALSEQSLLPKEFCLSVRSIEVDTADRRTDVLNAIRDSFVGWAPFSENELRKQLEFAFFWIDKGAPYLVKAQNYLLKSKIAFVEAKSYGKRNAEFEKIMGKRLGGITLIGYNVSHSDKKWYCAKTGEEKIQRYYLYTWRWSMARAVDKVRDAIFIMFCLMTGMRRRELSALTFDDIHRDHLGVWKVSFARFKVSNDPNYYGDADELTLPAYLGEAIEVYKKLRSFGRFMLKGYLFQSVISTREVNLTNRMIKRMSRALGRRLGIDHLHVHRYRKTIAEILIHESEKNVDIIRMIFGHHSYNMTLKYIARNPYLVASVMETLKEHFAADFVDVVRSIKTGVFAGKAAQDLADKLNERPELFSGKVLKITLMQYVSHMFEGGSTFNMQRTALGTLCMSESFTVGSPLPPCLAGNPNLIYPVKPDASNCKIHCPKNLVFEGSRNALAHNIKFYRTILNSSSKLKQVAIDDLNEKITFNENLLSELALAKLKAQNPHHDDSSMPD